MRAFRTPWPRAGFAMLSGVLLTGFALSGCASSQPPTARYQEYPARPRDTA